MASLTLPAKPLILRNSAGRIVGIGSRLQWRSTTSAPHLKANSLRFKDLDNNIISSVHDVYSSRLLGVILYRICGSGRVRCPTYNLEFLQQHDGRRYLTCTCRSSSAPVTIWSPLSSGRSPAPSIIWTISSYCLNRATWRGVISAL